MIEKVHATKEKLPAKKGEQCFYIIVHMNVDQR